MVRFGLVFVLSIWPVWKNASVSPFSPSAAENVDILKEPLVVSANLSSILNQYVDVSEWHDEMSFEAALDVLTESVQDRLPMVVFWKEIAQNALVYKETPIGINGVRSIRVRKALDILVRSAGSGQLQIVTDKGIVTIASVYMDLSQYRNRNYDTTEITSAPSAISDLFEY